MYSVLFDIDGTLIQTGGAGQVAFAATFLDDFGVAELPTDVAFAGRSDRAIAQEIMQHNGIETSEENWNRFVSGYRRRLKETLPRCVGEVLAGVVDLLDQLHTLEHVAVGLLTGNIADGATAKLAHYGIADRFAFGGFGDDRTDRNDIAADALKSAEQYTAQNGNSSRQVAGVMVIGDTPNDVRCARAIDAFAVAVATGGASSDELAETSPDLLLADLTTTDALLAEILGSKNTVS